VSKNLIIQELQFKAVRSSGAGGQHVNKVSSKIELSFNVAASLSLSENEKKRIYEKIGYKLTKDNVLQLQCDESRSQHKNKKLVIKRFLEILDIALKIPKTRHKTKPKKSAIEKRIKSKKRDAMKKVNRKKPNLE